jgi:hypothetical protein
LPILSVKIVIFYTWLSTISTLSNAVLAMNASRVILARLGE